MEISTYLLIITLNVNGLYSPIKARVAEWVTRHIYIITTRGLLQTDIGRLKAQGWKKIFQENGNEKASVAIYILDKIDFK